ncbi:hypothetical protein D3C72_2419210 [compost metagenome]
MFIIGAVMVVGGAAVALATNSQMKPAGANSDTVTLPDGTVVSSAYLDGTTSTDVVVVQIKQLDGKVCYGLTTQSSSGGASISCPP